MCGILCVLSGEGEALEVDSSCIPPPESQPAACVCSAGNADDFLPSLRRRGPDGCEQARVSAGRGELLLVASLLQLRGTAAVSALRRGTCGSVLCWNGEVFGGSLGVSPDSNDGCELLAALLAVPEDVPAVLSRVRGPWALTFWHQPSGTLYFGRDVLGRRSLLLQRPRPGSPRLLLSSSAPLSGPLGCWEELPPGIYSLNLSTAELRVQSHAWAEPQLLALACYARRVALPQSPPCLSSEERLMALLDAAVARRVRGCRTHASASSPQPPRSLMVAFSGGLDSALLAALAHRHVPPGEAIDLSSVCFAGGASADRLAARSALQELRASAPTRHWRLIEVDASLADMDAHRAHLLRLLHPCGTLMDANIGLGLWLAARGHGLVEGREHTSEARVVLFGAGADEQAAGYGRHRTAFQRGGPEALTAELETDVRRLWLRNLGRDDRLVSDCGRETRQPFLDEDVVAFLAQVPLAELVDFSAPPGKGDKRLLRAAAHSLGLLEASRRVKRAIQFGSGLSRLSRPAEGESKLGGRARLTV